MNGTIRGEEGIIQFNDLTVMKFVVSASHQAPSLSPVRSEKDVATFKLKRAKAKAANVLVTTVPSVEKNATIRYF